MGKSPFEQWQWNQDVAEFSHYHGDNDIFNAAEYQHYCNEKGKTQIFSGVCAQHHNAKDERAIQTVVCMAHTFMVHYSLHWSERCSDDISLWYLYIKHLV